MFYDFIYLAKGFWMRPKVRSTLMYQTITCKLNLVKKIFRDSFIHLTEILPFLSQKFTHDWQFNSICCKSSPYDQV